MLGTTAIVLLVAAGYFIATKIGFAFTPPNRAISAFWTPNALLLAALVLTPRRIWWLLLLAVFPAHLAAQLGNGVPHWTVLGWFIGNSSEALIGAFCITHYSRKEHLFDSVKGVMVFLVFGVVVAPFLTSFLDAGVVVATGWGTHFWILWVRRLFSNVLADLTIVPTAVILLSPGYLRTRGFRLSRHLEAALMAIATAAVTILAFGGHRVGSGNAPALAYASMPLFLWAALRFGIGGLSMSLLGVVPFAMWSAMHGHGPFISASPDENILALKVFFSTTACPLMLLSAYITGLKQSKEGLIVAQEQERRRIGRELHDDVAQKLVLIQLELEEAREAAVASFNDRLQRLSDQVAEVTTATRDISHALHPPFLYHNDLSGALRDLAQQISRGKSLRVHFACEGLPRELPAESALCVYRIAQEALLNVVKHSRARNVTLELRANPDWLSLNVSDDGIGFNAAMASEGLGLLSMRERVESARGTITITSAHNQGAQIAVSLPLHKEH